MYLVDQIIKHKIITPKKIHQLKIWNFIHKIDTYRVEKWCKLCMDKTLYTCCIYEYLHAGLSIRCGTCTKYFYLPKMVFGTSKSVVEDIHENC